MNIEHIQSLALSASNSLAQATLLATTITVVSVQQREGLKSEIKSHIDCAQHFIDGLFAELDKVE